MVALHLKVQRGTAVLAGAFSFSGVTASKAHSETPRCAYGAAVVAGTIRHIVSRGIRLGQPCAGAGPGPAAAIGE